MMLGSFIILLGGKESPTTNMLIKDLQGTSWDIFYTHNQLEHLLQKEYQCKKIDIGFYFQKATKEAIVKSLGLEG
ncbi:hypothetical protein MNB_SM-3-1092 [hydrothermal vent metagenome]|uniref:Uncharacterized protein n=1 Tax=hydrothermal vent metagenome TaxID=652676 RepID=A0A1W1D4C6_9ZZZZ